MGATKEELIEDGEYLLKLAIARYDAKFPNKGWRVICLRRAKDYAERFPMRQRILDLQRELNEIKGIHDGVEVERKQRFTVSVFSDGEHLWLNHPEVVKK